MKISTKVYVWIYPIEEYVYTVQLKIFIGQKFRSAQLHTLALQKYLVEYIYIFCPCGQSHHKINMLHVVDKNFVG